MPKQPRRLRSLSPENVMDSTVSADPENGSDTTNENVELPASVDSLSIDGTAPQVGDSVEVKVKGTVTRVVNDMAYIKPETINDTPMPAAPLEPSPDVGEGDRLAQLSQSAGALPSY